MPRRKIHPNEESANPTVRSTAVADDVSIGPDGSPWAYAIGTGREPTGLGALQVLCARNDGWLRIVPHEDGTIVYAKWKFTSRRWPNHYVMYRCDDMNYSEMLWGLVRKVELVDAGTSRPLYDHPYSNH